MEIIYSISFYTMAVSAIIFAVLSLAAKNIVRSLFSALISFLMTGLLIIFLGFSYLGIVMISLCLVEIFVFFIFSVMYPKNKEKAGNKNIFRITVFVFSVAVIIFSFYEMYKSGIFEGFFRNNYMPAIVGSKEFAEQIFVNYGASFVFLSVVFLSAILGFGVILAEKDVKGERK